MWRGGSTSVGTRGSGAACGRATATTFVAGSRTAAMGGSGVFEVVIIVVVFLDCGSAADGEAAGDVGAGRGAGDVHGT
jgi:hypothetical protein